MTSVKIDDGKRELAEAIAAVKRLEASLAAGEALMKEGALSVLGRTSPEYRRGARLANNTGPKLAPAKARVVEARAALKRHVAKAAEREAAHMEAAEREAAEREAAERARTTHRSKRAAKDSGPER